MLPIERKEANAVAFIGQYQQRHRVYHGKPVSQIQAYQNWKVDWIILCLQEAPAWCKPSRTCEANLVLALSAAG